MVAKPLSACQIYKKIKFDGVSGGGGGVCHLLIPTCDLCHLLIPTCDLYLVQGKRSVQCWRCTSCLFLFSHSRCCCSSTTWRFPYIQFINTALCFLLMQTKWRPICCCYVPKEFCCWIEQQWFATRYQTKYFIQALSSNSVPDIPDNLIVKFSRYWIDNSTIRYCRTSSLPNVLFQIWHP